MRYLGLPLITTKLNSRDCQPLIRRICEKIQCWTSSSLSQGGRLQLIKSTLYGILGFWISHMFLQKGLLNSIPSIFTKFLWCGNLENRGMHTVSWREVCFPKSEGGLGLKDLVEWNKASINFQLWRILQPAPSFIWVKWFRSKMLCRKGFWTINVKPGISWVVKKILKARTEVGDNIRYHVSANSTFLLWHDPWTSSLPLLTCLDSRTVSIVESHNLAKVSSLISNSHWELHPSNHTFSMDFRNKVINIPIHSHDHLTWDGMKCSQVKTSVIWNTIRTVGDGKFWLKAIWHSFAIPKCFILLWLAFKNRLLTKDRMLRFGMQTDGTCVLCKSSMENIQHILLVWVQAIRMLDNNVHNRVYFLFLGVAMHSVWLERNARMHCKTPTPVASLLNKVKRTMRDRLFGCTQFQKAAQKYFRLISSLYRCICIG